MIKKITKNNDETPPEGYNEEEDNTNETLSEDRVREIVKEEIETKDSSETNNNQENNSNEGNSATFNSEETDPRIKYATNPDRFKNRTRLAWVSISAMILLAAYVLIKVPPESVDEYSVIIAWCMSTFAAVILAYMGATSFSQHSFVKTMFDNKKGK